ncbi:MAG: hypothetical protein QM755_02015 [Luteolibacter sp.]
MMKTDSRSQVSKTLTITVMFGIGTFLLGKGWWILSVFARLGPAVDLNGFMLYLAIPILIHGFLVGRRGMAAAVSSTLLYAAMIAGTGGMLHHENAMMFGEAAGDPGKLLPSVGWCLMLLALGPVVALLKD